MHARAVERAMELLEVASSIARREILARVYYEVDLGEPVTVGAFSYISSSLRLIGLENVFAREPAAYMRPDFRRLAELEPDVIIYEARDESIAPGDVERMFRDRGLEELKAIREGRVIVLGPDSLAHYGPSHFKTLAELAKNVEDLVGRSP
ncbi:hypothetical protein B6U99_03915 [Candidatus Geothermarchaeota archaeon ex4572_27]|nr:MAG: hypothetical protein B6U99_03915 [Candidatus Geothermarchaeota archaeon ex4572_27]